MAAEYTDLHELAKGWKAAIARATDPATKHEAQIRNDRGNLPLHSATSFRAPIEVAEALLQAYPEAASITNNYGNLPLHFTAWKKGPLEVEKLLLKIYPEGAAQKNNHGNLPLHYAAHYNAPLEVVEALYNAYPQGATQKNNDNNTPLDLAIADGASPNVVSLLQGKSVPPTEDELLEKAKRRYEAAERELARHMSESHGTTEEMEEVLGLLMDIYEGHPHALYSAGINPETAGTMEAMMEEVRKAAAADNTHIGGMEDNFLARNENEEEAQLIEDALCPPDDTVEIALSKLVGLEAVKNQIRGMRRTMELVKTNPGGKIAHPSHIVLEGNPGVGKSTVATILAQVLFEIGVVKTENFVTVGRYDLIDRKSEARTITKTRKVLERAKGGVLVLNEAYTLLPSTARPRGRDHGGAALREIARTLPTGNPLVILTGGALELQRILSSEIGFKSHFLTRIEFADPTPSQIARIFMGKMNEKGLVPGDGVTVDYLAELISTNTDEDWRLERNGRIADLLLNGVRAELRKRFHFNDESSKLSFSPIKMMSPGASSRMPAATPDEVFVTVEDVQNAIVNGM
ncbi:sporulation protein K-like protein [Nitzschia inconspicua]|uniref:Sporulation protein K-like protein n=1 Tax=Nitzschia inconspicua TaxID=303405 RepID=A0A9K3LEN4_9STRA|nr:sporulation protein K-like protein [Nitzschia inconspicua]